MNTELALTGQKLTDILDVLADVRGVVEEARLRPFTVQSDFARTNSLAVALAASLGYITTLQDIGQCGKRWLVTAKGMELLERDWYV